MIDSYEDLIGDEFFIIGGFESGIDASYHLASRGKKVLLFDRECPWSISGSDPSVSLSTYSLERMRTEHFDNNVELHPNTSVDSVALSNGVYEIITSNENRFYTDTQPLLAAGFKGSHKIVEELFELRDDGFPLLNENDESTKVPGLYLCGPAVRHDGHIFCFIFKFRMRFAVVAKAIASSLDLPAPFLEEYRNWGMYLDDLSCCGEECIC